MRGCAPPTLQAGSNPALSGLMRISLRKRSTSRLSYRRELARQLVGLLIDDWQRRRTGKPVAYLTLTNQLARQVLDEAETLANPVFGSRRNKASLRSSSRVPSPSDDDALVRSWRLGPFSGLSRRPCGSRESVSYRRTASGFSTPTSSSEPKGGTPDPSHQSPVPRKCVFRHSIVAP